MSTYRIVARLDWLIEVRGARDEFEARDAAYGYIADQEIEEQFEYTPATPEDTETTITLYPADEVVPADEEGPWSTYTRD